MRREESLRGQEVTRFGLSFILGGSNWHGQGASLIFCQRAHVKPSPTRAYIPDFAALPRVRLQTMQVGGDEILECYRVLGKAGLNVVGEVLRGQGTFYENDHYPSDDVFDNETHAQYYYHAHRGPSLEHGHFHTFLRAAGMPEGVAPVANTSVEPWPQGGDALSHLIAISMDEAGFPVALFTVNRWVTGDTWYPAPDVEQMLDCFVIDHAFPSWPVNRWITAMFRLFRPQMVWLLKERDAAIGTWSQRHPKRNVFEDRELDVTGWLPISVEAQIASVNKALKGD